MPAPQPHRGGPVVGVRNDRTRAWTEFARSGVPSSPDGTPWPAATATAPRVTVIDDKARNRPLDVGPVTELINSIRVGGGQPVGSRTAVVGFVNPHAASGASHRA